MVGLGIGLPLLLNLENIFCGWLCTTNCIDQLINGEDVTNEIEKKQLKNIKK